MARRKHKVNAKQKNRRKLAVLGLLFTAGKGILSAAGGFVFKRIAGG